MRTFNYTEEWRKISTPEINIIISEINRLSGRHSLYIEQKTSEINILRDVAKIQSIHSSNSIEGIFTTNDRLRLLVEDKTTAQTRDELEMIGYRDVLSTIHENYRYIPLQTSYLLQLHKILYASSGFSFGGTFKNTSNEIIETLPNGEKILRFKPLSPWETPEAIDIICKEFNQVLPCGQSLLLIPIFILDFLCIHPFNDGNGRMSRLLTLLLLYRSDFLIGQFISIEKLIEDSKELYYKTLHESSTNWIDGKNDYFPFAYYLLQIILKAYVECEERLSLIRSVETDRQLVLETFETSLKKLSKKDVAVNCPSIPPSKLEKILADLVNEKIISLVEIEYFVLTSRLS